MPNQHTVHHSPWDPNHPRAVIHSLDEIPAFADECEEVEFWDTHEMSDELWDSLPAIPDDELARLDGIRARRRQQRTERATG